MICEKWGGRDNAKLCHQDKIKHIVTAQKHLNVTRLPFSRPPRCPHLPTRLSFCLHTQTTVQQAVGGQARPPCSSRCRTLTTTDPSSCKTATRPAYWRAFPKERAYFRWKATHDARLSRKQQHQQSHLKCSLYFLIKQEQNKPNYTFFCGISFWLRLHFF